MRRISLLTAAALYGVLVRLLLPSLSERYGAEIRASFADTAIQRGAVWSTWAYCILDLLARLPAEWRLVRRADDRVTLRPAERIHLMFRELSQAARSLARRPGFTVVTVLTLALGIGANVAIFAVVNTVLVKPLPYPEPDGIVTILHHAPGMGFEELSNSSGTLALYRDQARSFSAVAAVTSAQRNLTGGREPARVQAARVTPSLFDVLRVKVVMGRPLHESDAVEGAAPVTILTHSAWQRHFGGAPDVIGRTMMLDGVATEIIGVMPPDYRYPDSETALLLPLPAGTNPQFGDFGFTGLARLAPGVTLAAADAELKSLQSRFTELYGVPEQFLQNVGWNASLETLRDNTVGDTASGLWIVFGAVSFLLLVACASVANLFLVRAESRQREIGVRLALGATRARVASAFLYESVLLGLSGGAWGLALGTIAVRALIAAGPPQVPRLDEVSIDARVILFATIVSIVAGLLFGALPMLRRGAAVVTSLAGEARGNTSGRDRQHARKVLIVAQLALAIILLTGSGLMLRSFERLRAVDLGIETNNLLTIGISAGSGIEKQQAAVMYRELLDEVRQLPGIREIGLTNALPLRPEALNGSSYEIEGIPVDENLRTVAMYSAITDGFLNAMRTTIVAGRDLERADSDHRRPVTLINETFVRTDFAGRDPIGARIRFSDDTVFHEVVGVVRDVRIAGAREEIRPVAYLPMTTTVEPVRTELMTMVVLTEGDPMAMAAPISAAIRRANPDLPLISIRTMDDVARESMADTSFIMTIILIAAVVSMLLGAIGLYGVIGYVVAQRTREIGVRLALGALPAQVHRMVMRQGLYLAVAGVAIGIGGALALTRLLESVLFEVDSRDPFTFAIVPVLLLGVSALAAYMPARRAARVPPMHALREE